MRVHILQLILLQRENKNLLRPVGFFPEYSASFSSRWCYWTASWRITFIMNKFSYFGMGEYPPEYIRRVHGPYDPSRYYGKPDTPLGEVKMSELPRWVARRNWSPMAIARATARGWWRWQRKYTMVRYGTAAPWVQFFVSLSIIFYGINYKSIRLHNRAKYH